MPLGLCLLATILAGTHGCGGCSRSSEGNAPTDPLEVIKKAQQQEYAEEQQKKAANPVQPPKPPPIPQKSASNVDPLDVIKKAQEQEYTEEQRNKAASTAWPPKPGLPHDPQQKSARPKDVADWKRDDYYSAKRDGDPRLAAAVMRLGEQFAGKESAAELLTKLLESPADVPLASNADDEAQSRPGSTATTKLTKTIIIALVANGTPRARQTLECLISGTLKTANPQASATAALEAMLDHSGTENEELLFRFITARSKATAGDQTVFDTERLSRRAIDKIAFAASESLRLRLANYMLEPETPQPVYDQLWACLKEPRAENLSAQLVLYQNNRLDAAATASFEQLLAVQSAGVLGRLLGFPVPQHDQSRQKLVPAILSYRLADQLWSTDCAAAIARRLHSVDALSKDARLVTTAGTIPESSLRAALLRTLQRHWDEGPKGLESLVAPDGPAIDPGFLLLVKMLPRKDAPLAAGSKDARGREANRAASATKSAKIAETLKAKQLQDETAQHWMKFSHDLVSAMCRRFCSAAQAAKAAGTQVESAADAQLPVKLHPNAEVTALYRLDWPDGLDGKIATAPSLHVRYVRLELKAQPARAIAFYRRQLPDCEQHENPGGGWLDSLNANKKQAIARSVDVMVTKVGASARGLPDQEQELTVDILSVECERIADRSDLSASR